ncbi:uncharacterized protein LOC106387310 [Brassica napus]|nr:PREDICTED: uncharacterized protein LOC106337214 [Brassica oleracea var. oleracea]XP_013682593.1 uncharacterized protein LOC106387310 [Brassica napus]
MVNKPWKIIPRPLLETVLNNHVQRHRVPQPLILHGPRGVGKTTLILNRLLRDWNKGPHIAGYVDFAQSITEHHPDHQQSYPWTSWTSVDPPLLSNCKTHLENCLESMTHKAIKLGTLSSQQIFTTMNKWHGLTTSLRRILQGCKVAVPEKASVSFLWERAVYALSVRRNADEIDLLVGLDEKGGGSLSVEEASYYRETAFALRLAKEVIKMQQGWRGNAIAHMNRTNGFSKTLANSCTDWPLLMIELLSQAAEIGFFQPKLVLNNIEILKSAIQTDDSTVSASMYHDNLVWRIIALGANERCLPVLFVTSDSYYSYQAFVDFGFPDIFISRETFGWTPQEAKLHMVPDYFSASEWTIVADVLGANSRHLFELYALKQSNHYQSLMGNKAGTFEDIVDAYLAYLQVVVVNPAMEKALLRLQRYAADVRKGSIPDEKLRFGAAWRHPPRSDDPTLCSEWAKIQLMDFVQALVNTELAVNYLGDYSLEIFEDPSAMALVEVGILYTQRDPSFFRPISQGIKRCLVRWLIQERMKMNYWSSTKYWWQRIIRGRYYKHLMLGYRT